MKDFFNNIGSIYWWLSVVAVGVLINLFSAYLKNRLDARLSKVSSWWRNRSEARKAQRLKEIDNLCDNPSEQIMMGIHELRIKMRAIFYWLFSILTYLAYSFLWLNPSFNSGDLKN